MPRGTLVVDEKLLRDHFLRQQRSGNITGYRGARTRRGYGIGGIFKSLARYAIPLFKQGAKVVGKRALQAAAEVGQDVLQGKNVKESVETHGGKVVKDFAEQGLFCVKRGMDAREGEVNAVICQEGKPGSPRLTKWITDDESSYDDESDSETSQTSDDIY
jgi:hypothetical protein